MLTVFTPVYNRAYIIGQLYESLTRQTSRDFEWVVVDDGSTDNIDELMERFIAEGLVDIRYFKQPNGGKHTAINHGVREARGEMFFIVDSDDYLADDAVEFINRESASILHDPSYAGISGLRVHPDGSPISRGLTTPSVDGTLRDIRIVYKIKGDLAEVYKTGVLREFPFPIVEGERFCAEALVWFRISNRLLKLRLFNVNTYVCDYLPDGLTSNNVIIRRNSPVLTMMHYCERFKVPFPFMRRLRACINFWRFAKFSLLSDKRVRLSLPFIACSVVGLPVGRAMRMRDTIRLKNKS